MPAALEINKNEVEMNVRQYGVREAARMMGLNENTVLAWAARGEWLSNIPRSSPLPPTVRQPAIGAISGPKALASAMLEDSVQTRASLLRTARRASARVERCDDDELMLPEVATVLNQHAKTAALAGGWNAQTQVTAKVSLNITGGHAVTSETPTTLDAQWREMEDAPVPDASTNVDDY